MTKNVCEIRVKKWLAAFRFVDVAAYLVTVAEGDINFNRVDGFGRKAG